MPNQWDLTGQNIENTYQRVLQTPDGVNIFDGTGSLFHLGVFNNTSTGSYGSFYDTGSQTAVSNLVIYSMSLSTTDLSNGVYIDNTDRTRIYVTNGGVYNVQFSAQFSNSGNNPDDVSIWIRKNDVGPINDVPDSSGICTVPAKKGNVPGQLIASWNYYLTLSAGDFIQLCWHTITSNTITLETIPAGTNPTHPRTPSLILTANRIDTFFSNTGSFSGSFIGQLIGTASWATSASNYQEIDPIFVAKSASLATTGSNLFTGNQIISGSFTDPALRVTQTGTGLALRVEDESNPDSTPFVIDATGSVGIGTSSPAYRLDVTGSGDGLENVSARIGNILIGDWGPTPGFTGFASMRHKNVSATNYAFIQDSNGFTFFGGTQMYFGLSSTSILKLEAGGGAGTGSLIPDINRVADLGSSTNLFRNIYANNGLFVSGNVGIGTVAPSYRLDVSGSTRIYGDTTITGSLIVTGIIDGGTF